MLGDVFAEYSIRVIGGHFVIWCGVELQTTSGIHPVCPELYACTQPAETQPSCKHQMERNLVEDCSSVDLPCVHASWLLGPPTSDVGPDKQSNKLHAALD